MVIYIITIAGLFSRKMAHILNQLYVDQIGIPIRHYVKVSYIMNFMSMISNI